jgi:hypothetical protein
MSRTSSTIAAVVAAEHVPINQVFAELYAFSERT